MAAIGTSRTLPLVRGVREHPSAQGVSLRGPADLAMGSEATQSESQGDLGAHDAPGEALAATGPYLSPLPIAEHGRYYSRQEPGAVCVGKAGISLSVKVRPGQSRADRPAASLAGVAVTRGLKRRQQVHGVYGSNPEMGMSWRPSWKSHQRRQHGRSRYARGRLLRRGLRVGHVHTVDIGTQEIRQGPLAGHQRGRQGREDRRLMLCPGRKSDRPILSMKSPKVTR